MELVHDLGYYKSLRGNGVIIFPGAEYTDFEVYVTDTLPDVRVQCTLNGEDQDPAVSISVCKTNLGNRILVFLAIILFVLMDFLVLYRKYIVEGSVSIRQQIVFWVLLGSVFLAYFPYLTDYFSLGVDTTYHLLRIEGLKNTLEQGGHFPTRIHAYYNYGHGSLIPSTYSDLFLYFPALLRLTGFSAMTAYKMFVFAVVAAVAVISYVSFKRCMKDSYAALFASVVCLFSPYFLSNVYHRGAIGEALALAFVPPVCCGMYLLFTEENDVSYKYHKWWIVAGISGLLYSHLLSAEVVIFFMLLVCAAKWKKTFRRQTFWQLAESVLLVILLNCWYWLPMLYLMGSETYQLWEGYSKSIQESGLPFSDMVAQLLPESQGVPTFLGAGMTVAVVAYPFLRVRGILQKDRKEQILVRSCNELWVLTVLAVVISTKYFPWDALWKLPFISFFVSSLQFPAHFMVPGAALCAMFAGFLLLWLKSIYLQTENKRSGQVIVGVLVSLVISGMVYQVNSIAINYAPAYLYTAENMGTVHSANRFFLSAECELKEFQYHRPVAEEGLKYTDYALNGTKATLNIENTVSEMRYLEIPLTAYRGYELQASSDQGGQPYITEARGAHGDIRVAIPGDYEGNITVSYKGPILFHIAEGISIISFISFALWETLKKRARYRNRLLHSR
ncbi:MAG: hypothetical protein HFH87_05900 [Lachnospiraceae bacterium]|nr:hypothetical protein [Lachnospiraceae bacterium]